MIVNGSENTLTDLYEPYWCGAPYSCLSYNGGVTSYAIRVLLRHLDAPQFEREPTAGELRLVVEYCAYYIWAPIFVTHVADLAMLRRQIEHVRTVGELERWLYECAGIGIEPL
jgi:hypothetical protein